MRADLTDVVRGLLDASQDSRRVSLDDIGEAIGTRAVSTDDVDDVMRALEREGRTITGPEGGGGEERLRGVLAAARALVAELGRKPSVSEIASRSGLSVEEVRQALALAQVIQR